MPINGRLIKVQRKNLLVPPWHKLSSLSYLLIFQMFSPACLWIFTFLDRSLFASSLIHALHIQRQSMSEQLVHRCCNSSLAGWGLSALSKDWDPKPKDDVCLLCCSAILTILQFTSVLFQQLPSLNHQRAKLLQNNNQLCGGLFGEEKSRVLL